MTYTVVVSGLGNLPGDKTRTMTYNIKTNGEAPKYNGTAHVGGTFNSTNDDGFVYKCNAKASFE